MNVNELRELWMNGKTATIRAQAYRDMERARKQHRAAVDRAFIERAVDRLGIDLTVKTLAAICEERAFRAPEGENVRWAAMSDELRAAVVRTTCEVIA